MSEPDYYRIKRQPPGGYDSSDEGFNSMGVRQAERLVGTNAAHPTIVRDIGKYCRSVGIAKFQKQQAKENFTDAFGELTYLGIDSALTELFDYSKNHEDSVDNPTPGVVLKAVKQEPVTSWGVTLRKSRHDIAYYDNDLKVKISEISDMIPEIHDIWDNISESMKRELVSILYPEFTEVIGFKVGDKLYYSNTLAAAMESHHSVITGTISDTSIYLNKLDTNNSAATDEQSVIYKPIIILRVKGENGIVQDIVVDDDKLIPRIKVVNS